MHPGAAVTLFWGLFVLSWLAAAFWTRRPEKRVGLGNELPYRVVLILGYVLLFHLRQRHPIPGFTWHPAEEVARAAAIASLAGFFFAWWARLHLGLLWSSGVTRKPGHHIVDSGPYALVRHPIYAGLLWSSFCTLFAYHVGPTPARLLGFGLICLGFWMKAKLEEDWLSIELGGTAYASYRARVPMLLPFWR
jgi:protein-S-isoprenylcysteine O-methyltransferase Ste14